MTHQQEERLLGLLRLVQVGNGLVGNDVGDISFAIDNLSVFVEVGIVVDALSSVVGEDLVGVKPRGFRFEVPFSYRGCLVACLLQVLASSI